MSNAIDTTTPRAQGLAAGEVRTMPTEFLRAELARVLQVSAADLVYLADIWAELENRGEDLSDLRRGMGVYLPMIARGQLAAEAVVRFAGHKTMLTAMAQLPVAEQRRLADGGTLPLVMLDERDGWVSRDVPADALTTAQVRQVFGPSRLQSTEEQYSQLAAAGKKILKRRQSAAKVVVDRKAGELRVGDERIAIDKAIAALRAAGLLSATSA
jgi:hypothetical protein